MGNIFAEDGVIQVEEVRIVESGGGNKVSIDVPNLSSDIFYTLPPDDGASGEVLTTDGAGNLSWQPGGGGGDDLGNHTAEQNLDMSGFEIIRCERIGIDTTFGNNDNFIDFDAGFGDVLVNSDSEVFLAVDGTVKLEVGPFGITMNDILDMTTKQIRNVQSLEVDDGIDNGRFRSDAGSSQIIVEALSGVLNFYNANSNNIFISNTDDKLTYGFSTSGFSGTDIPDTNYVDAGDSSDERLKENMSAFSGGLDIVTSLSPVQFDWKEDAPYDVARGRTGNVGLVAQDVEQVAPSVVYTKDWDECTCIESGEFEECQCGGQSIEDRKFVDYGKLTVFLIDAVQELSAKLDDAEARIASLEEKH